MLRRHPSAMKCRLLRASALAGTAAFALQTPAHAVQFTVTNGTTQTAPGPSYSATGSGAGAAALFANNANSVINGNQHGPRADCHADHGLCRSDAKRRRNQP